MKKLKASERKEIDDCLLFVLFRFTSDNEKNAMKLVPFDV